MQYFVIFIFLFSIGCKSKQELESSPPIEPTRSYLNRCEVYRDYKECLRKSSRFNYAGCEDKFNYTIDLMDININESDTTEFLGMSLEEYNKEIKQTEYERKSCAISKNNYHACEYYRVKNHYAFLKCDQIL